MPPDALQLLILALLVAVQFEERMNLPGHVGWMVEVIPLGIGAAGTKVTLAQDRQCADECARRPRLAGCTGSSAK